MEIVFDNVVVEANRNTLLSKILVDGVNLNIEENKITAILGNSNSGKTVIGELINAVVSPTSGKVFIGDYVNDGSRIKDINFLRMSIGFVPQSPKDTFISKTVYKELLTGMEYFNYKSQKKAVRAEDAMKLVGLPENLKYEDPMKLSISEARRLSIGCVLTFNPKVIILDEPSIGLNTRDINNLIRLINLMKKRYKKTIIILSKDTDFLYKIAEEVIVMKESKVIRSGGREILEDSSFLTNNNFKVPFSVSFVDMMKTKNNVIIDYSSDIKDIVKGVCRNVL
ncbi:MAG: energy-coupling factor ABC transporter ATP-binding protein [Bacilli bacterium]